MLLNAGKRIVPSKAGLLTTVCYKLGDHDAVYVARRVDCGDRVGRAVAARSAGIIKPASEIEALAASVEDTGRGVFVPAFSGLFAPYWRSDARGAIVGL